MSRFITIAEAKEEFGKSESTLRRIISKCKKGLEGFPEGAVINQPENNGAGFQWKISHEFLMGHFKIGGRGAGVQVNVEAVPIHEEPIHQPDNPVNIDNDIYSNENDRVSDNNEPQHVDLGEQEQRSQNAEQGVMIVSGLQNLIEKQQDQIKEQSDKLIALESSKNRMVLKSVIIVAGFAFLAVLIAATLFTNKAIEAEGLKGDLKLVESANNNYTSEINQLSQELNIVKKEYESKVISLSDKVEEANAQAKQARVINEQLTKELIKLKTIPVVQDVPKEIEIDKVEEGKGDN